MAGACTVQVGHGRIELAEAAAKQAAELAFFPLATHAHPKAVELAERLAHATPGDLNRVHFTCGGSEGVESAWKFAKQYFRLKGQPGKHKVISRVGAYHGTTHGAMAVGGLPWWEQFYGPLVPGGRTVPNAGSYRAPALPDGVSLGEWAADQIARAIEIEGAGSVAAVFLEPVQSNGGAIVPPTGYFKRVREICDAYDVLMVADEVVCAFGRLGTMFGSDRYESEPDMMVCAKGLTSGYAPLGAVIVSDRVMEPFVAAGSTFLDGYTFGGHPVSTAVAMANLDILEREMLFEHVRSNEKAFRTTLEELHDLPIVGDVRGDGYLYGIELVKDKATKETFESDECERLLKGFLSPALYEAGLHCRVADRESPIVLLAPPLICDQSHFDEIEQILRGALSDTWRRL
jgi:hypothetical protein